jgi:predicted nuclease of predicted toxin-antitoxin system
MKLLADVNVSQLVVERLRSRGIDIARVTEFMNPRAPDTEILAEAKRRHAVLVSFDQDFSAMLAIGGEIEPSLINLRVTDVDTERVAQAIVGVIEVAGDELVAGAVVTVDDAGVRIHRLPLG